MSMLFDTATTAMLTDPSRIFTALADTYFMARSITECTIGLLYHLLY
jgi:hypothetical protein